MKTVMAIMLALGATVTYAQGQNDYQLKILQLEKRIKALEKGGPSGSANSLKVKDLSGKEASTTRSIASHRGLSSEKSKEILKQVQQLKEKQIKSQKILEELLNEDF